MKIDNGLEMLALPAFFEKGPDEIHPAVLWDDHDVVLVDVGLPGQLPQIRKAMENAAIPFERLSIVIITHHDMDHIGSLRGVIRSFSRKIDVLAHEAEKPYIEARIPPIRLSQLEAVLKAATGERRQRILPLYENLKNTYAQYNAKVDRTVCGGETLACCGGIEIIHTPGHTPGHISLYLKQRKTLIAGDMLNAENQTLAPAPPVTVVDPAAYVQSLKKLTRYDIQTVLCYHGGLYRSKDIGKRISELIRIQENRHFIQDYRLLS